MSKKYQTLIFDFDGTLVDSLSLQLKHFNQIAKKYRLPQIELKDLERLRNYSALTLVKEYKLSPWRLLRLRAELLAMMNREIDQLALFPGLTKILPRLAKQQQLGILSSNQERNIRQVLGKENLNYFSFLSTEKDLFSKANKLKKLIKKERLEKESILYFGDEIRDIEACRQAGIEVAAVTWGLNSEKSLSKARPDFLLREVRELLEFS